jgi:aryl-alcohol dehydrogenase-like predicted oxidoreductase
MDMTLSRIAQTLPSSTFPLGGDRPINRLAYGTRLLTGPGGWGPPDDPGETVRTLRALSEGESVLVDTAHSYGPGVAEKLVRDALHPYANTVISTKGGLRLLAPGISRPEGRPEMLLASVERSLQNLGVEQIPLFQLQAIDPDVPRDEQFAAVKSMLDTGLIAHAGLCEVSVEDIEAASAHFSVTTVQNTYSLFNRRSDDVLQYCDRHGIAFLSSASHRSLHEKEGRPLLSQIAAVHRATIGQVALAWLLQRNRSLIPVAEVSTRRTLTEMKNSTNISLSQDDLDVLNTLGGA